MARQKESHQAGWQAGSSDKSHVKQGRQQSRSGGEWHGAYTTTQHRGMRMHSACVNSCATLHCTANQSANCGCLCSVCLWGGKGSEGVVERPGLRAVAEGFGEWLHCVAAACTWRGGNFWAVSGKGRCSVDVQERERELKRFSWRVRELHISLASPRLHA